MCAFSVSKDFGLGSESHAETRRAKNFGSGAAQSLTEPKILAPEPCRARESHTEHPAEPHRARESQREPRESRHRARESQREPSQSQREPGRAKRASSEPIFFNR